MKNSSLLLCLALLPGCGASLQADSPAYNLLVIQTDEHNYRTLSCYQKLLPKSDYYHGTDVISTPNIDWIADHGAICTSFYATTPVCSPSRSALVSGRYPQNTPVVSNDIPLADDIVTFAEILRRKGYATGYAGKWHLDGTGKPQWAPGRRFGFEDNRFMFNRGHWKKFEDTPDGPRIAARNAKGQPTYSVDEADEKTFSTDWLANKAVDFIGKNKAKPFCYMVSFPDPHGPNTVRAPYNTRYAGVKVPTPDSTLNKTRQQTPPWAAMTPRLTADTVRNIMPAYYGMVECLDDNIGKILDTLRRHGLIEKTVIVFTSDHGDLCGEHGRLNKGVPYEGSARIPFLLYFPGKIKSGTVVHEALSCVDFLPTVLSLMGVKTPGKEQGRDASDLFGNRSVEWEDIAVIRSTGSANGWLMAVTDRYKLIFASQGKPWLFDLKTDPDELNNALEKPGHRPTIRRLASALLDYDRAYGEPFLKNDRVSADVAWAVSDKAEYTEPAVQQPRPQPLKKRKGKKKSAPQKKR